MLKAKWMAAALVLTVSGGFLVAQGQPPAPPQGAQGGGQGGGRGGGQGAGRGGPGAGGAQQPAQAPAPARGISINANPVQKAHAEITGENGIKGTADLIEYAQGNGQIVQVVLSVEGLPPGLHGVHIHAVGKCDAPAFTTAGGHFDPGPAGNPDADVNHPFHSGDLPNLNAGAGPGAAAVTTYTTRFNLGGALSLFDDDGSAIIIHANPDTYSSGPAGSGVGGGPRLACGIITK